MSTVANAHEETTGALGVRPWGWFAAAPFALLALAIFLLYVPLGFNALVGLGATACVLVLAVACVRAAVPDDRTPWWGVLSIGFVAFHGAAQALLYALETTNTADFTGIPYLLYIASLWLLIPGFTGVAALVFWRLRLRR